MLTWIKQILTPPIFEDETLTRTAALLNAVLLICLAATVILFIGLALASGDIGIVGQVMIVTVLGLLFLLRRGYVQLVGVLITTAVLAIVTFNNFDSGGMRNLAVTGYFLVIIIASILLGGRAALVFGGLSGVAALGLYYAETKGWVDAFPVVQTIRFSQWLILSVILGLAAVLLYFAQNSSRRALQRAQDAEKALRESEARYRAIVQVQTELVCRNLPDGTLTFVNEAYCRYFDKQPEELIGRTFMPLILEQDHEAVKSHFASIDRENPVGMHEHRVILPGGEIRWQQWVNQAILNEHGDIVEFQAVGRDVTRRREAEEALRESEERFRRLVEFSPVGIAIHREGKIVFANPACTRLLGGGDPQELVGKSIMDFVPPDYRKIITSRIQQIRQGQDVPPIEEKFIRLDGKTIDVQATAVPFTYEGMLSIHVVFQDITERKRAEQSLRDSEERYRTLVETSPDAITLTDMQGNIIFCNQQAAELYGLETPEQALGLSAFDFIAPEDCQRAAENLRQTLEMGRIKDVEYIFAKADSSRFEGELNVSAIRDVEGQPVSFIGVARDITQRKRAEQALHRYAERLKTLYEIDQAILALRSPEAIARAALERLMHLVPCQRAMVVEFDKGVPPCILAIEAERGLNIETKMTSLLEALDVDVFKEGWLQSEEFPDSQSLARPVHELLLAEGIRSYLMGPLIAEGKLIGMMHLDTCQPDAFTADHEDIVAEVATSLAVAIREARLYEQTRQDAATKAVLLQEINHRVKNNLSAIIGLLYAEQRHTGIQEQPVYQSIMKDLVNRVQGMATVHHMLSDSEWSSLLLSELVAQIIRSALQTVPPSQSVIVDVSSSLVRVTPRQTTSLALVINELTTNTIKYALLGRDKAQINVRIVLQDDVVCLEFGDDGPGYPEDVLRQERTEVGLYLAQAIVSDELNGELSFCNDNGALATIRFRLDGSED